MKDPKKCKIKKKVGSAFFTFIDFGLKYPFLAIFRQKTFYFLRGLKSRKMAKNGLLRPKSKKVKKADPNFFCFYIFLRSFRFF